MNIRKKLVQAVVVVGLLGAVPSMAFADTAETGATGGWIEGEGYFTNRPVETMKSKPDYHRGWREGSCVVGETKWSGVKHYTRARMESMTGEKCMLTVTGNGVLPILEPRLVVEKGLLERIMVVKNRWK